MGNNVGLKRRALAQKPGTLDLMRRVRARDGLAAGGSGSEPSIPRKTEQQFSKHSTGQSGNPPETRTS
jgi:hypothetical protein